MRCKWLRRTTVFEGMRTSSGIILGFCGYLGGSATDIRCEDCPHRSEGSRE